MGLVQRAIEGRVRDALRSAPVVVLVGPRGAGKTTLVRQLQAGGLALHYASLDDGETRAAANADPEGFVLALPRPAVIEELQLAPALLPAIRDLLARDTSPGQLLLTGGAGVDVGAPAARLTLWPLAHAELAGANASVVDLLLEGEPPRVSGAPKGRAASAELVLAGGFPAACASGAAGRARYFRAYAEAVVARDLPQITQVRLDAEKVGRLLALLARRTSAAVNHAALARELVVDDKTVKAYVDLLERLGLLRRLPAWPTAPLGARQVTADRMLLCDSGMAASLAAIDADAYAAHSHSAVARMLLETFAVMELVKQATWDDAPVALSFYRDTEKRGVDLVIESQGRGVVAVSASVSASHATLDTRGPRLLRDRLGSRLRAGVIVYTGEETIALEDRLWALPVHGLLG